MTERRRGIGREDAPSVVNMSPAEWEKNIPKSARTSSGLARSFQTTTTTSIITAISRLQPIQRAIGEE